MMGGVGNDTYVVDNVSDVVTELEGEGVDLVQSAVNYTLSANVENLTLTGSSNINGTGNDLDNVITGNTGSNALYGLGGNDTLNGGSGNDTLNGGIGADTMAGNAGNDTYVVDDAGDMVIESLNQGTDLVQSSIDYTLTANVDNLTLTGTANLNGTGNTLNNVITGNTGDNVLDGGAGADTLVGGLGADTYVVDSSSDVVTEYADGGNDTVHSSVSYTLSANVENLTLTGTANINATGNSLDNALIGNSGNNILSGGAGNDILDGGAGVDTMSGGTGDDRYVVDNISDVVNEAIGSGNDTVTATVDYTLSDNVENLVLGGSALYGAGNALSNVITGNSGNNILDGGNGADTLAGGAGDDSYIVDNSADIVLEHSGEGIDTVLASASYALSSNIENLTLIGDQSIDGVGNDLDNVLVGNNGNNVIDGAGGADIMAGNAGDDTYIVDGMADQVIELASNGTDTVVSTVDYTLGDNVENLRLAGANNLNGAGNGQANVLEGNSGDNALSGMDGNDTLYGYAGNDLLDGGAGVDTLAGGSGDDTYIVESSSDSVIETVGEGTDTVLSSVSFGLSANVENLSLQGMADIDGVGNSLNNTLTGNAGNNALYGGDGNDTLGGGVGDDLLAGGAGEDAYHYNLGDGNDRIEDMQGFNTLYFGAGISTSMLEADRVGDDLVIHVRDSQDFMTLDSWFTQTDTDGLNSIVFEDGTVLDREGIEELMNQPPIANTDLLTVYEDGGALTTPASVLLANDTDPNPGDVLSVVSVSESSMGATVTFANNELTYDIGGQYQELAQGETLKDSFIYTISDQENATATGLVEVNIVGVNDAPVTSADAAIVVEDWQTEASGNVLSNDHDIDHGTVLQVAAPGSYAGDYGSLTLQSDGSYTYALDNGSTTVQSLGRDALAIEHYAYAATDGITETASTLDVYVHGVNDAPVVAMSLEDQNVTFNKPFYWQLPEESFVDIDAGDALTYTATLADGSPLPDWLVFDEKTLSFSGMSPKELVSLEVSVTATDYVAATGSTEGSLSVSDVFTLTVSHGNEGVGNGQDAAPAGQSTNFNDGPGTSQGNPGARLKAQGLSAAEPVMTSQSNTEKGLSSGVTNTGMEASDEAEEASTVPAFLGSHVWEQLDDSTSHGSNGDPAVIFARWLEMDLAISKALADQQGLSAIDEGMGAEMQSMKTAGYLGSTVVTGKDVLSLQLGSGHNPQGFHGISGGVQKIG
jgi:VCBS repeat-containing protein